MDGYMDVGGRTTSGTRCREHRENLIVLSRHYIVLRMFFEFPVVKDYRSCVHQGLAH